MTEKFWRSGVYSVLEGTSEMNTTDFLAAINTQCDHWGVLTPLDQNNVVVFCFKHWQTMPCTIDTKEVPYVR